MRHEVEARNVLLRAGARSLVIVSLLSAALVVTAAEDSGPAAVVAASSADATKIVERVRAVITAVCSVEEPAPTVLTHALGGAVELSREPLRVREREVGTRHSLLLPDGARIRLDRLEPGGVRRRVMASYAEPTGSTSRPVLLAIADGACNVVAGRRIDYHDDGMARSIAYVDASLERAARVEPLNPPVPPVPDARKTGAPGTRVALVDSGVNYLLPEIASRLARDARGGLVGFDFWDLDTRPFDANPARGAFHPQRHGTRTASLILEEAPVAALVPYRYPRHHMSRMAELVEHAAAASVRIMNLSMGSRRRHEWADFESAARARPEMLFVVSAGNDGIDIDETPVYPASLALDNLLTVTSSGPSGLPAPGSNWGAGSVDLAVPGERVLVTGFDGRPREVSGSSYAAARVSALAACLLSARPESTTAELKSAILSRAEAPAGTEPAYVREGVLRDPVAADRGGCDAERRDPIEIRLGAWDSEDLYPEGARPARGQGIALDIVILDDSGWRIPEIHRATARAAQILAQCEVSVDRAALRIVEAPRRYRHLHDVWSPRLVRRLDPVRPAVFFVDDTLRETPFEAEAFGGGNSSRFPSMRGTVWITRDTVEVGVVLAHELYHVLTNSGRHESDPENLMYETTDGTNTRLDDWQCERLR